MGEDQPKSGNFTAGNTLSNFEEFSLPDKLEKVTKAGADTVDNLELLKCLKTKAKARAEILSPLPSSLGAQSEIRRPQNSISNPSCKKPVAKIAPKKP